MPFIYQIAADLVVVLHCAYAMTIVIGLLAIWIGIYFHHQWVGNFWLRTAHLTMILIVVAEAWAGITCPLTTWESQLRELAQQKTYQGAFIANLVHDFLFYDAPPWVFTVIYSLFGLLVLASFLYAPPRWPGKTNGTAHSS